MMLAFRFQKGESCHPLGAYISKHQKKRAEALRVFPSHIRDFAHHKPLDFTIFCSEVQYFHDTPTFVHTMATI